MAPVTVMLHGTLDRQAIGRERTVQVDLQSPSSARQLLEGLGLPVEIISMLLLNGRRAALDDPVAEGDLVEAFPMLCGGAG